MDRLLLVQCLFGAALLPAVWRAVRGLQGYPSVPVKPAAGADAPKVSILVPARNEERSIERCITSLLAQRYPHERLEVLAIDDRSSDATPSILQRLAAADPRLKVLMGTELPAGWMGKCWALHQAAGHASPDSRYLLFVDADTVHEPSMLASAVAYAEQGRLDLLSLGPGQELGTTAERWLLPTILALTLSAGGTLAEVNDADRPRTAKAVGQFMLFARSTYEAIGGHSTVRGEIVEDFALARLVKGRGYRLVLADGRGHVTTRMYHSAAEIWEGFSKNAFNEAQKQRETGGALGGLVALPLLALVPHLLALAGVRRLIAHGGARGWLPFGLGAAQSLAALLVTGKGASLIGLPWRYALTQPIATLFLWAVLLNSTWRTLSGRGVTWKGRTY